MSQDIQKNELTYYSTLLQSRDSKLQRDRFIHNLSRTRFYNIESKSIVELDCLHYSDDESKS